MAKSRDEIASAYRSEPWWYDLRGFFILTFAYNSTLPQQLRFFGPNFGPKHLELACGTGTLLELILRWRRRKRLEAVDITGVDYAESMLGGAIKRFKDARGMEFVHADAAQMPFDSNTFDTINIANSVHCFPEVSGALRGVYRVLKPGGKFAANVLLYPRGHGLLPWIANRINAWGIRKGILFTPYEQDEIESIITGTGFEIVLSEVSGNCLNLIATKRARESGA